MLSTLALIAIWWRRWILLPALAGLVVLISAVFAHGLEQLAFAQFDIKDPTVWHRAATGYAEPGISDDTGPFHY